jgi:hypothetical protein
MTDKKINIEHDLFEIIDNVEESLACALSFAEEQKPIKMGVSLGVAMCSLCVLKKLLKKLEDEKT